MLHWLAKKLCCFFWFNFSFFCLINILYFCCYSFILLGKSKESLFNCITDTNNELIAQSYLELTNFDHYGDGRFVGQTESIDYPSMHSFHHDHHVSLCPDVNIIAGELMYLHSVDSSQVSTLNWIPPGSFYLPALTFHLHG